jgi:hypothetical protein
MRRISIKKERPAIQRRRKKACWTDRGNLFKDLVAISNLIYLRNLKVNHVAGEL